MNHTRPTEQYEQAGITWYTGGKPVFKLVKELVDGELCIIPGKKPMATPSVRLRLVIDRDDWIAQFRPEGATEFETAATGKLPPPADDQVSIQCTTARPAETHWIRFDDFRIAAAARRSDARRQPVACDRRVAFLGAEAFAAARLTAATQTLRIAGVSTWTV